VSKISRWLTPDTLPLVSPFLAILCSHTKLVELTTKKRDSFASLHVLSFILHSLLQSTRLPFFDNDDTSNVALWIWQFNLAPRP
jgi:hypothetical protein